MPIRESRARILFEEITAGGDSAAVALLKSWVASKKQESDFLEFKGGRTPDKELKKYWSQMVSGFANTEGGVFVLGIRAASIPSTEDNSRKIDAASELDLAPRHKELEQLLKNVKLDVTNPPVAGIEYRSYDAGKGDGSGFVVCFVPEGVDKPYRAELDSRRQYYQRIGDSFTVINHSLLRSLFYPQTAPCFEVDVELNELNELNNVQQPPNAQGHPKDVMLEYRFGMSICNVGTASARDTVLAVGCNYSMFDWAGWRVLSSSSLVGSTGRNQLLVASSRPIHPLEDKISCFSCTIQASTHLDMQGDKADRIPDPTRIVFVISVYALDARPFRGNVAFGLQGTIDVPFKGKVVCGVVWEK